MLKCLILRDSQGKSAIFYDDYGGIPPLAEGVEVLQKHSIPDYMNAGQILYLVREYLHALQRTA